MNTAHFAELDGYALSYTIVEYMISEYGYDKLIDLIKSPYDFDEIFSITIEEFEKEWKEYLIKNYNN